MVLRLVCASRVGSQEGTCFFFCFDLISLGEAEISLNAGTSTSDTLTAWHSETWTNSKHIDP